MVASTIDVRMWVSEKTANSVFLSDGQSLAKARICVDGKWARGWEWGLDSRIAISSVFCSELIQ